MAQPITKQLKKEPTEQELKSQTLDDLLASVLQNADGLKQTAELFNELHENGIIEILVALLKAKEKIAVIAVDQVRRPPVTNMINNAMAAAGALTELKPDTTKKLVNSLASGIEKAEQGLKNGEKVNIFDLIKLLKDPDINRTLNYGINLLKGMGQGLK